MASERDDKRIWWIFFLLGMGTLLPWNFFITPFNYWMEKLELKNESNPTVPLPNEEQKYKGFWSSTMALATMATNFAMCFVTTILMNKIGRNIRFIVPIIGIGICFAIAAVYTKLDTLPAPTFFAQTMINVVIITAFCAVLQASLFGHGSEVGGVMPAIMGGQGVGGIMASVTDIVAKLVYDNDVDAAMFFFVIPAVFMILTGAAYMYLQKLPSYQEILKSSESSEKKEADVELTKESEAFIEGEQQSITSVICDFSNGIAIYMFCVFFTFTVTLGMFPAVVVGVNSVNYNYTAGYEPDDEEYSTFYTRFFLTICVFLLFNVTDTVGRMGSEYFTRPKSVLNFIKPHQPMRLLGLVLLRIVLILLLGKCNVFPSERADGAIWFQSDFAFILFMVIFGVSNGLCSSIAMAYAPQRAPEHARERIGGFMGTVLVAGLFSGASISYLLVSLTKSF